MKTAARDPIRLVAAPPSRPELVRLSTLEAEGDYLLGRQETGGLILRLWRVRQKNL
jgi:hypothetical protein